MVILAQGKKGIVQPKNQKKKATLLSFKLQVCCGGDCNCVTEAEAISVSQHVMAHSIYSKTGEGFQTPSEGENCQQPKKSEEAKYVVLLCWVHTMLSVGGRAIFK